MVFLTAQWRNLLVINYVVSPELLLAYLPSGTEFDFWEGKCFLSLVAFEFLDTRVLRCRIPGHSNFVEVNLRFYVVRGHRRGVVFIRELVPKWAIAAVARYGYGENYLAVPMTAAVTTEQVSYEWQYDGQSHSVSAKRSTQPRPLDPRSFEAFILEHYWGYTKRGKRTLEYRVEHPPWRTYKVDAHEISVQDRLLPRCPHSVMLAEGSAVSVSMGSSYLHVD